MQPTCLTCGRPVEEGRTCCHTCLAGSERPDTMQPNPAPTRPIGSLTVNVMLDDDEALELAKMACDIGKAAYELSQKSEQFMEAVINFKKSKFTKGRISGERTRHEP